jgi:hypothetical protein
MDNGPTDGPPGDSLSTVSVSLTESEAHELFVALQEWSSELRSIAADWHTHITDSDGNELTIAIE